MAQNSTAVAKIDVFKGILNSQTIRAQLKNSLKENAGAFMSSMIDLYSGDATLQGCDPEKVALECIKAASLKLPINKALGFAYVVPYKGVPTFTIGYKGLIQLAQRTGQYRLINADVVLEGELTSKDKLSGEIDMSGEAISDKVIGYFAYFKLLNGFEKIFYMTKEQATAWMTRYSPSHKSPYSPWQTEFDKMAMKTVLRRLFSVYGPMSMEMQEVIAEDDSEAKVNRDVAANANLETIDITPDTQTGEVKQTAQTAQTAAPQAPENDVPPAGF